MALLKDEQEAKAFVQKIGVNRAKRVLNAVSDRISRRIKQANKDTYSFMFDESSIRRTELEVTLIARLKMGLQLLNTDTPNAAHKRILWRIAERKKASALKRNLNPLITAC